MLPVTRSAPACPASSQSDATGVAEEQAGPGALARGSRESADRAATVNRSGRCCSASGWSRLWKTSARKASGRCNQDLLDWLAVDFMDSGWSIKHVLKTMVMSAAYQQSSKVTPELLQRDPENRLAGAWTAFPSLGRDDPRSGARRVRVAGGENRRTTREAISTAGLWQELAGRGRLQGRSAAKACIAAVCIPIGVAPSAPPT